MGLRSDILAAVSEAFDSDLADAVATFMGSRVTPGTYDPVTETTVGGGTVTYSGRGVFADYDLAIVNGIQIVAGDLSLTALQPEVTDTPKVDDKIVWSGATYRVVSVGQDPAGATWSVQLRSA